MSSRIKITLPDEIAARLDELAAASGEPVSRVAGQMVRDGLAKLAAAAHGNGTAPADELTITRAPWLEPYGGDRNWRQLTWGAIIALYGRYPEHLKGLKIGWWEDDSTVELLCAFAHWRQMLDDGGTDPRQELDFQFSLIEFGRGSGKWAAVSPRSGNRAQPRTSGTDARQRTSGHRGARPHRLRGRAGHRGDAGVGSGCGRVAAATCTGGVGFACLYVCATARPGAHATRWPLRGAQGH